MNLLTIMFGTSMLVPHLVPGLVIGVILGANGCVLLYLLQSMDEYMLGVARVLAAEKIRPKIAVVVLARS